MSSPLIKKRIHPLFRLAVALGVGLLLFFSPTALWAQERRANDLDNSLAGLDLLLKSLRKSADQAQADNQVLAGEIATLTRKRLDLKGKLQVLRNRQMPSFESASPREEVVPNPGESLVSPAGQSTFEQRLRTWSDHKTRLEKILLRYQEEVAKRQEELIRLKHETQRLQNDITRWGGPPQAPVRIRQQSDKGPQKEDSARKLFSQMQQQKMELRRKKWEDDLLVANQAEEKLIKEIADLKESRGRELKGREDEVGRLRVRRDELESFALSLKGHFKVDDLVAGKSATEEKSLKENLSMLRSETETLKKELTELNAELEKARERKKVVSPEFENSEP